MAGIQEIGEQQAGVVAKALQPEAVQGGTGGIQQQSQTERHWRIHARGGARRRGVRHRAILACGPRFSE